MGDPSLYVVANSGGWQLFYSHRGAARIEVDLIAGPAAAVRFITAQRPVDGEEQAELLDDMSCHAAALIDLSARRLLYFSDWTPGRAADRRVLQSVLNQTWPGWSIEWAYDGIADLMRVAGLDVREIRPVLRPRSGYLEAAQGDQAYCLVTVDDGAQFAAYALVSDPVEIVESGMNLLTDLPEDARLTDSLETVPVSGVHVDVSARAVGVWTREIVPGLHGSWDTLWPGWRLAWWADRHEEHRGRTVTRLTWPIESVEGIEPARAELTRRVLTSWGVDPDAFAATLTARVQRFQQQGVDVINPRLVDHVQVVPTPAEQAVVLDAINTASAQLQVEKRDRDS